jgi:hypothetical protein
MNEIINMIVNNGLGVVCVAYMIYFQATTMKDMMRNQEAVLKSLEGMNHRLDLIESKIEKKGED